MAARQDERMKRRDRVGIPDRERKFITGHDNRLVNRTKRAPRWAIIVQLCHVIRFFSNPFRRQRAFLFRSDGFRNIFKFKHIITGQRNRVDLSRELRLKDHQSAVAEAHFA